MGKDTSTEFFRSVKSSSHSLDPWRLREGNIPDHRYRIESGTVETWKLGVHQVVVWFKIANNKKREEKGYGKSRECVTASTLRVVREL